MLLPQLPCRMVYWELGMSLGTPSCTWLYEAKREARENAEVMWSMAAFVMPFSPRKSVMSQSFLPHCRTGLSGAMGKQILDSCFELAYLRQILRICLMMCFEHHHAGHVFGHALGTPCCSSQPVLPWAVLVYTLTEVSFSISLPGGSDPPGGQVLTMHEAGPASAQLH